MSARRWKDRSTVTLAVRPDIFEFVTCATVQRSPRSMEATYRHRYEIAVAPGGSEVTYTFTQLELVNPFLRLGLPVVRTMTWRVAIPFLAGRGFRNLLALAEQGANLETASQTAQEAGGALCTNAVHPCTCGTTLLAWIHRARPEPHGRAL